MSCGDTKRNVHDLYSVSVFISQHNPAVCFITTLRLQVRQTVGRTNISFGYLSFLRNPIRAKLNVEGRDLTATLDTRRDVQNDSFLIAVYSRVLTCLNIEFRVYFGFLILTDRPSVPSHGQQSRYRMSDVTVDIVNPRVYCFSSRTATIHFHPD